MGSGEEGRQGNGRDEPAHNEKTRDEQQELSGDGGGTFHQAGFAAGGSVLMDNAALPGFVNDTDCFGDTGRDFFGLRCSGGNQAAGFLDVGFDLRFGGLVAKLTLARALDIFDDGLDIGHGVKKAPRVTNARYCTRMHSENATSVRPGLQCLRKKYFAKYFLSAACRNYLA
jgi:hypothetical protein